MKYELEVKIIRCKNIKKLNDFRISNEPIENHIDHDPFEKNIKEIKEEIGKEIVSMDVAPDLDYEFGSSFENSRYVWDTCVTSSGGHYGDPNIRYREYRDKDMTYVAPTKYELIKFACMWSKLSAKDVKTFYNLDADEIAKILLKFKN